MFEEAVQAELEFGPDTLIRQRQDALLRSHVRRLAECSPYYRRLFAERGIEPQAVRGCRDLPRLPFTGKEELERENRRLHRAYGVGAGGYFTKHLLAGDWITLYAAWEALAVASWVLIGDGGTPRARAAASLAPAAGLAVVAARNDGGAAAAGIRPDGQPTPG